MSPTQLAEELRARGLLPAEQAAAIQQDERTRPFSLHQELRAALYLGILLLTGGLGALLYQHVDDIGFEVIVFGMFLLMLASFSYVVYTRQPFTWEQTRPGSFVPDYVLLLGCLLFLALDALFSEGRHELATLLPAGLFLGLAYRFDHRGVLAMGITALASWVGVSIAPLDAYSNGFHHSSLSSVGVGFGLLLVGVGLFSDFKRLKQHFAFTYISLGANLALVAAASILLDSNSLFAASKHLLPNWLVVLIILALSAVLVWYARHRQSYLFLLLGAVYAYFAVTYLFLNLIDINGLGEVMAVMFYFMVSAVAVIMLFLNSKKILRLS